MSNHKNTVGMILLLLTIGIVLVGLLWFFRTWFHAIIMIPVVAPWLVQIIVVSLIVGFIIFKKNIGMSFIAAAVLFIALIIPVGIFSTAFRGEAIYNQTEFKIVEHLPENSEEIRLMPYDVSRRYARDSLQMSQYKLGTPNISLINDKMSWHYPLIPDGLIIVIVAPEMGLELVASKNLNLFLVSFT